jgi:hypothetical protein
VIDQILVAGEAEGAGPGDLADAGWGGLMAPGPGAPEVGLAGVGSGRGLVMALDAAHVGLVVSGVAAGAVGLGGAECEATGVAGCALDVAMGVVIEGQQSAGLVEGTENDIHGSRYARVQDLEVGSHVTAGAIGCQRLGVVAGSAVPQPGDEGAAVGPLAAVAGVAVHLLVLGVTEGQIQGGRAAGERVALEASRLRHADAGRVAGDAVFAATRDHDIMRIMTAYAIGEDPRRKTPVVRGQQLGALVTAGSRAGGPDVAELNLRHHVMTRGADRPVGLVLGHGPFQAVLLARCEALEVHPDMDARPRRDGIRRDLGPIRLLAPEDSRPGHPDSDQHDHNHTHHRPYPSAPAARARAFLSSEHLTPRFDTRGLYYYPP